MKKQQLLVCCNDNDNIRYDTTIR